MRARGILKIAVAAAAAVSLAGCGDFLTLDARAPNACVTIDGIHVPGLNELPTNYTYPPAPTVTTKQSIDIPFDAAGLPKGSAYSVKLTSFKLESQGTQTLDFVESAKLSALSGGKSTLVATYTRTATAGKSIETAANPPADVTEDIVNDVLHLQGELTGTPPAKGFAAAATVCFDIATTLGAK